ncbi:hypothetical protein ACH4Y0_04250 [Streptomyces sp. NPDC020707]|uniref:hypothetical protein n=1 Tax=Streptomyces sp. NPDC020707 TaxID=3365084 RepID=UPI00379B59D4
MAGAAPASRTPGAPGAPNAPNAPSAQGDSAPPAPGGVRPVPVVASVQPLRVEQVSREAPAGLRALRVGVGSGPSPDPLEVTTE